MTHWSENKTNVDTFTERAQALGHSLDEALEALSVAKLSDLPGSIGNALNRLAQLKKNGPNTRQRIIDRGATDQVALAPLSGAAAALYGDHRTIQALAHRARRFFSWAIPKGKDTDLDDVQVVAAVQYSLLIGANPACEIHAWWDPKNQVFVIMPHYSYHVRKAREIDPRFMCWFEQLPADDPILNKGDVGVVAYGRTGAQQDFMVECLRGGVPYETIAPQTCTQAIGVFRAHEKKNKKLPKGWASWHTRAKIRAMTSLIRQAIGTTSLTDRQRFQAMGMLEGVEITSPEATEMLAEGRVDVIDATALPVEDEPEEQTGDPEPEEQPVPPEALVDEQSEETVEQFVKETGATVVKREPVKSWPGEVIQALIEKKLADNPNHAARMLAYSNVLQANDSVDTVVGWADQYKMGRRGSEDRDECAAVADTWLTAQLPET